MKKLLLAKEIKIEIILAFATDWSGQDSDRGDHGPLTKVPTKGMSASELDHGTT